MAEAFFIAYLLVLLLLPSVLWWRWGLAASLVATVLELGLVVLVFYLLAIYHLLPDLSAGKPPAKGPMEHIRRSQGDGQLLIVFFAMFPGLVALIGGGLAVVWSAVLAVWRLVAERRAAFLAGRRMGCSAKSNNS